MVNLLLISSLAISNAFSSACVSVFRLFRSRSILKVSACCNPLGLCSLVPQALEIDLHLLLEPINLTSHSASCRAESDAVVTGPDGLLGTQFG